jgi:hypothetical protein
MRYAFLISWTPTKAKRKKEAKKKLTKKGSKKAGAHNPFSRHSHSFRSITLMQKHHIMIKETWHREVKETVSNVMSKETCSRHALSSPVTLWLPCLLAGPGLHAEHLVKFVIFFFNAYLLAGPGLHAEHLVKVVRHGL